jgi:hypothetical protein
VRPIASSGRCFPCCLCCTALCCVSWRCVTLCFVVLRRAVPVLCRAVLVLLALQLNAVRLRRGVVTRDRCQCTSLQVRSFGKQLFVALMHLHQCEYVHADLKPDNILVGGEKRSLLKVCVQGSHGAAGSLCTSQCSLCASVAQCSLRP